MNKNFVQETEIYQLYSFTSLYIKIVDAYLATYYPHTKR